MASCITPTFGNSSCPQVQLTVNQTSETNTTATLSWSIDYVAHGYAFYSSVAKAWSVVIDGSTVGSGSFSVNGITGTRNISSGTTTVSKTSGARSVSFSVSFSFNASWNGTYGGTKSDSGSISISASGGGGSTGGGTTYTIRYYANGGSGAPSAQTKTAGNAIALSSTIPKRTGYSFLGWATTSSGVPSYQPGQFYYNDSNLTLYAIWEANTYTVVYNANGGSGAPASQTKTYGVSLTLSSTVPTRSGYQFRGWGTSSTSSAVAYSPGDRYTSNSDLTLYAIWTSISDNLNITNLSVDRCTSSGTLSESGTYGKVTFDWRASAGLDHITIGYRTSGSTGGYTTTTVTGSSTSGSVNRVVGGSFDSETNYDFQVIIYDDEGLSATYYATLSTIAYAIDFRSGGKGVTIGEAATADGFHVRMNSEFHNPVTTNSTLTADGAATFNSNATFNGTYVNASGATYLRLPDDVRINNTQFLTPQPSSDRPLITNHMAMDNNVWLQLMTTSNAATNFVRMNSSNQVELNWTNSAPLAGMVGETIWSGTGSGGTSGYRFSCSAHKAYNLFILTLAKYSGRDEHATRLIGIKGYTTATSGRISAIGGMTSSAEFAQAYTLTALINWSGNYLTFFFGTEMGHNAEDALSIGNGEHWPVNRMVLKEIIGII